MKLRLAIMASVAGYSLIWLSLYAGDSFVGGIIGGILFGGGLATGLWGRW